MVQTTSKKMVRSSEKRNRVRAYRTHPTPGLKVLCRLRLADSLSIKMGVSYDCISLGDKDIKAVTLPSLIFNHDNLFLNLVNHDFAIRFSKNILNIFI